jgi:nitrous oxidase accessory protein NosD
MSSERSYLRGLTALSLHAPAIALQAATLCVNSGRTSGCFAHINDAISSASVASTIKIAPGTYNEAVVITKSLSLVGENGAIVDATGLPVGIFVNGLAAPGLSDVLITGLTVENANFEGILIANASAVTVSSNQIFNN